MLHSLFHSAILISASGSNCWYCSFNDSLACSSPYTIRTCFGLIRILLTKLINPFWSVWAEYPLVVCVLAFMVIFYHQYIHNRLVYFMLVHIFEYLALVCFVPDNQQIKYLLFYLVEIALGNLLFVHRYA